jgi:hypothetical protein
VDVALAVGPAGVREGAGLPDGDAAVVHRQTRGSLEGEGAAAGAGTNHHGHPGTQVRCEVATEGLGGERGPDHEDDFRTLHGGCDVRTGVRHRGEALQPSLARDTALCPDCVDVFVSVCGSGVQRDPVALLSAVEGDSHASVAGTDNGDVHGRSPILRRHGRRRQISVGGIVFLDKFGEYLGGLPTPKILRGRSLISAATISR